MNEGGDTGFLCVLHNLHQRTVVNVQRGALVCHKCLDAGNAVRRKLLDFVKHLRRDLGNQRMQRIVDADLTLCTMVDSIIDRVDQALAGILRGIVNDGRRAANADSLRCLIRRRVLIARIAKCIEVRVLVDTAGENILAGSVNDLIRICAQIFTNGNDSFAVNQNVCFELVFRSQNGTIFDQCFHDVLLLKIIISFWISG